MKLYESLRGVVVIWVIALIKLYHNDTQGTSKEHEGKSLTKPLPTTFFNNFFTTGSCTVKKLVVC